MNLDETRIVQNVVFYIFISIPVLQILYHAFNFKNEKIFLQFLFLDK